MSSGAKSPSLYLFAGRAGISQGLLGEFFERDEDRGRKASGKKTKARSSFRGGILHLWVEVAKGPNNLLSAALSCLDVFSQVESSGSSTV